MRLPLQTTTNSLVYHQLHFNWHAQHADPTFQEDTCELYQLKTTLKNSKAFNIPLISL